MSMVVRCTLVALCHLTLSSLVPGSAYSAVQSLNSTPHSPASVECTGPSVELSSPGVAPATPVPFLEDVQLREAQLPGVPAPAEVRAMIEDVAGDYTRCLNAGDYPRAAYFLSDRALQVFLRDLRLMERNSASSSLTVQPMPIPEDERLGLDVRKIRQLGDGRVGAIIDWCVEANFFVFVFDEDEQRWLIDEDLDVLVGQECLSR
jgi:hypothetical protein